MRTQTRPLDLTGPNKRSHLIREMFSAIAPTYDRMNHLLSLNRDRTWRRTAIKWLNPKPGDLILDLCGGTGDLALQCIAQQPDVGGIVVADFALPMLRLAKQKGMARIAIQAADALCLPYRDASFNGVMIAFGVRNFEDTRRGILEAHRVLRDNGILLVLEFFRPVTIPLDAAFRIFFRRIMPIVGRAISGHDFAYSYLPESVSAFYTRNAFEELLTDVGFWAVRSRDLDAGIASIVVARKNEGGVTTKVPANGSRP